MNRRAFLKTLSLGSCATLAGCSYLKIDLWSPFLRSDVITTPEQERSVLSRARLSWTADNNIRVIHLSGSSYERGYQHGALLRDEVQRNLTYLYESAVRKFHMRELFSEAFERARPFISEDYMDEMHGLAHGSKLPLELIHHIHILPEIGEWGGKRQIKSVVKQMMNDELGTSCSNFCSFGKSTDGAFYAVRILDWGLHRISKLHKYPLIQVHHPDKGYAFANIGWVGFIGAISGMNARGITLGEMGYGNPEGETLHGKPMPFLLRDVLQMADSVEDARHIISTSPGTCSYVFLVSDGKEKAAEIYVRDKDRFRIFKSGDRIVDRENNIAPIDDVLYAGHWNDRMETVLNKYHGQITPEIIMREVVPFIAMPSNFQNVIYDPVNLRFWVANAPNSEERAAEQPYTFFDLKAALG